MKFSFLAAVPFLAFSQGTLASTFTLGPAADAMVTPGSSGELANNNYGGAGSFSIAGAGLPKGEFQSVMRFDLAPAVASFNAEFGAGNWRIESVRLQLTATMGGNPILNTSAAGNFGISWIQNDSWIEGSGTPSSPGATGITFNTLNTFVSAGDESIGTFHYDGIPSGATSYTMNLTPGFQTDLESGGLVGLRFFPQDATVSGVFNSRSFNTASARPVLSVVAVPEPGTVALGAFGLVFLATCARRRR